MRRNNRYFNNSIIAALIVLTGAVCVRAQSFKPVRQLTSNNIVALAGGGDTLWMATERGFNYRTSTGVEGGWLGFEVNDLKYRFRGLGFGGGAAVALIDKDTRSDSIGFWQFSHNNGSQRQKIFKFPWDVNSDSAKPTGGIVYSNGSFWAPFGHGGLVRYDPADNSVHAIRPADVNELPPQNLVELTGDDVGAKAVLALDINLLDNSITVTAPKTLWRYHPAGKQWESIDTNPVLVDTDNEYVSFDAAFTVRKKDAATLYSFIVTKRDDGSDTALYAFDEVSKQWRVAVNTVRRYFVFPAVNGCIYTLYENNVSVYAGAVSAAQKDSLSEIMKPDDFRKMLSMAGDDPNPNVNDILFLPKTDSSGTLIAATETGLYISESVEPLSNRYDDFKHYRYVRDVGSGEVYALPGIIRGGMDLRYGKCVFVYKLKNDGDVTIRVYDYNMSLVKTVVNGERRRADKSRSTDPVRDVWDGTNGRGKRVWPGVYYFKITSNAGERLFGKVILAK
ncbi:MAG: hypothetical protein LBB74_09985 [Chitinispirillales bacterium]|jgi:hypothetical protein|nr:hypothetical protein [Chitinispirillales bacterium]